MKRFSVIFSLVAITTLLLSSCGPSLSPFTEQLKQRNGWDENDLERIQFYLSEDVVLRRQITDGSTEITSGEIKIIEGKQVEEIIIASGTPGILLFQPNTNRMAISFEEGDDKFLIFGPSNKTNGQYTLKAQDWNRDRGVITYGNRRFYTASENAYAKLMVDLKKLENKEVKSRRAEGRKIDK